MFKRILLVSFSIIILGITYFRLFPVEFQPEWNQTVPVVTTAIKEWKIKDAFLTFASSDAYQAVELTSSVSERVKELHFIEGDKVDKGQLIAVLEQSEQLASLEEAQKRVERIKALVSENVLPEKDLENAIRDHDVLKAQLDKYTIRAPFSGVLGSREVEIGALVSPGTLITTLDQYNKMKIIFSVPEKYASDLQLDQDILFKTPQDDLIAGKSIFISPRIDPISRTILVKAVINNNHNSVRPGMSGKVKLLLSTRAGIVIPEEALVSSEAATFVYVVNEGNAQKVNVVAGRRFNGAIEIISGLNSGQELITEGMLKLKPGNPVEVVENQVFDFDSIQNRF